MNKSEAQKFLARYRPCAHENADTRLGNGKIWARCEDCGETFLQENWDKARETVAQFDKALEVVMVDDGPPALVAYAKERGLTTMTVEELITSHRRVVEELNSTSRPEYKKTIDRAYKAAFRLGKKQGLISIARLRRMSLAKIAELIG